MLVEITGARIVDGKNKSKTRKMTSKEEKEIRQIKIIWALAIALPIITFILVDLYARGIL